MDTGSQDVSALETYTGFMVGSLLPKNAVKGSSEKKAKNL